MTILRQNILANIAALLLGILYCIGPWPESISSIHKLKTWRSPSLHINKPMGLVIDDPSDNVVPTNIGIFTHAASIITTGVLLWASYLNCKYHGCSAPMLNINVYAWANVFSPVLIFLVYSITVRICSTFLSGFIHVLILSGSLVAQVSVFTYITYALFYIFSICPRLDKSLTDALEQRETNLKQKPVYRLINKKLDELQRAGKVRAPYKPSSCRRIQSSSRMITC